MIESVTAHEIRLTNGVVIAVHSNSYRSVRGRTLLACIFGEIAFWRDDTSANPDIETYRAVLPSLAGSGGMLIGISTPYRCTGLLHTKFRDSTPMIHRGPRCNPTINKANHHQGYGYRPGGGP